MKQNHLANEKTPYLLQHAHNPVDWYPWGKEAFEKAKKEDKPVFLSIGYSTCHWCHVMEKESFADEQVAKLLNDVFVCIKVDREERPDIDAVYMDACQKMTGSGGWPLTIFMTPEKKPFFVATYIPKQAQYGQAGLLQIIPHIQEIWQKHKDDLVVESDIILSHPENQQKESITPSILHDAYNHLSSQFDPMHGGFGNAPKFPTAHPLLFLLRYWKMTKHPHALEMVEKTLIAMRSGGIFDQVGFGFHRYAADERWRVPHFEKMLADQALLVIAYTEAYHATKRMLYKKTVEEILTYVFRELTSPEGGFYTGEDADSEWEEGKFYTWNESEIADILKKDADGFLRLYGLENFEEGSILYKKGEAGNDVWREKLLTMREKRVHPFIDDKILTDGNGLLIAALAKAGRVLNNEKYIEAAEKATAFLLQNVKNGNRLQHLCWKGNTTISGFLDDYIFLAWGLFELYEATFNEFYLKEAMQLVDTAIGHFWDNASGFFMTADDAEVVVQRKKEAYDGAIPSGNSVALLLLLWFSHLDMRYRRYAEQLLSFFSEQIAHWSAGHTFFLLGVDYFFSQQPIVVFLKNPPVPYENFLPVTIFLKTTKNRQLPVGICTNGKCLPEGSPIQEYE